MCKGQPKAHVQRSKGILKIRPAKAGNEIHKETWLLEGEYPREDKEPLNYPEYVSSLRSELDDEEFDLIVPNEESKVKENFALLNDLLSRPPTLLSLCRTFIRKRTGRRLLECVSKLRLPKHLEGYLTLADFKTNLASLRSCKFRFDGKFKKFSVAQKLTLVCIKTSLSDK